MKIQFSELLLDIIMLDGGDGRYRGTKPGVLHQVHVVQSFLT